MVIATPHGSQRAREKVVDADRPGAGDHQPEEDNNIHDLRQIVDLNPYGDYGARAHRKLKYRVAIVSMHNSY